MQGNKLPFSFLFIILFVMMVSDCFGWAQQDKALPTDRFNEMIIDQQVRSLKDSTFNYLGRINTTTLYGITAGADRSAILQNIASKYFSARIPVRFQNKTDLTNVVERIEVLAVDKTTKDFYLIVNSYNVESYFVIRNQTIDNYNAIFTDMVSPYFPTAFDNQTFVLIFEPNGFSNILKQSDAEKSIKCRTVLQTPAYKMFSPSNARNQFVISNVYGKEAVQVKNSETGLCLSFNRNAGYSNNLVAEFAACNVNETSQLFVWTGAYLISKYGNNAGTSFYALKRDFVFGTSFITYSEGFKYSRMTLQLVTPDNYNLVRADKNIAVTNPSIESFYSAYDIVLDDALKTRIEAIYNQTLTDADLSRSASFKWSDSNHQSPCWIILTLVFMILLSHF